MSHLALARWCPLVLAACLLAACPQRSTPDASDTSIDDVLMPMDAGTDAGADVAADDGAPPSRAPGFVSAVQQVDNDGGVTTTFTAGFGGSLTPGFECTTQDIGPCTVLSCVSAGADGGTHAAAVHAGTVTVQGAMLASPVQLQPATDGTGTYAAVTLPQSSWTPGQTLDARAVGSPSGVPAFDQMVTTPSRIALTSPVFTGAPLGVPRASDFALSWTGGTVGDVIVILNSSDGTNSGQVRCRFSASAGSGTVPSATLSMLPAGSGLAAVEAISTASVSVDRFDVQIVAEETYANAAGLANFP